MLIQAVVAAAMSAPIVFLSRKRIDRHPAYAAVLVVPIGLWLVAQLLFPIHGKSMSNFAIEVGVIILAVPTTLLIRAILGRVVPTTWAVVGVVGTVSIVTVAMYVAVPPLPE